jgi:hypothetical protein
MFTNTLPMFLHIAPHRLISDVQKEFNTWFPYLKLEFFRNNSFTRRDLATQEIIPQNRKIAEGQTIIRDGDIEISEEMKVREIERIFKDKLNLTVQVFRKSGNLWLETTMTDNWTLHQQNNHGKEISTGKSPEDKTDEYD